MQYFVDKIRTNAMENGPKLAVIISSYMDRYIIYRMMRKFDGKQQKNIIFYGGEAHTKNIYKVFNRTKYFETIVDKYSSHIDCIDV